jgi:hypothetical protein
VQLPSSNVVLTVVFLALELLVSLKRGRVGEDSLLSSLQAARKGRLPRARRLAMPKIWFDFMLSPFLKNSTAEFVLFKDAIQTKKSVESQVP